MKKVRKPAARRTARKATERKTPAKNLREWGQRRLHNSTPWLTVALTHVLVRSADRIYEFEQSLERGETSWIKASQPDLTWEDHYRRPHKMFQRAINLSFPADLAEDTQPGAEASMGLGTVLRLVAVIARRMKRMGDEALRQKLREAIATPEGLRAAVEINKCGRVLRRFLSRVDLDGLVGLDEPMDDQTYEAGIAARPVQFFILVWIPCLIAHGESPKELFQQSEQGNREAMEKLLQVDKRLMWCPTMAKVMDDASRNRQDGRFADFMKAMGGTPGAMTLGRYKCAITAYILRVGEMFRAALPRGCHKVTGGDVRDAFDAAARERGLQVDEDLPVSRESFRKAVQRLQSFARSKAWDIFPL